MSITSEIVRTQLLRDANQLNDAGSSAAAIAATLQSRGWSVPREQPPNGDNRLGRHAHGRVFAVDAGDPGRWTGAVVTALLAVPEAVVTSNYAAAYAKLGSDASTTLTVT